MTNELPKAYDPKSVETRITERWLATRAFSAIPDGRPPERRYVIMMPLPNVTGALHMGHAMDNVMQDMLVRWHRMMGDNTLWQPGTDHAGIATQAVVEKRLFELEGKTRHVVGREALVARIWAWKDEYQARIVRQQQKMGCSCDWDRQRFTMDGVCTAAVRETFFRLYRDRLLYRGDRLVNWDCQLQTAVADDEVYHETVEGSFWHLSYPVIDPRPGEPDALEVATTRPETMLGDTAVACHPDPAAALEAAIEAQRQKVADVPKKERAAAEAELARLEGRRQTHLPTLLTLRAMAADGRAVMLPLQERPIPIILDEWAKPELGSGCVKITPAHDPNDYEVWQRHGDHIAIVNLLSPDGTLNDAAGAYAGLDRFEARKRVVADLEARGRVASVEARTVEIGHSDRSKTPIEPYLSKQWFVRMGDVDGGVVMGRGTGRELSSSGLAQAAIDAVDPGFSTASGRRLEFHPGRYVGQYVSWLSEKRDWCISRQLWWGHRIPVWVRHADDAAALQAARAELPALPVEDAWVWVSMADGAQCALDEASGPGPFELQVCLSGTAADEKWSGALATYGFTQDPDVLDTWFSSSVWPFSTLGWPDPASAPIEPGQRSLADTDGHGSAFDYYYPGSCLVTGRDIITLWVARMLIMGLYNHGEVPFTDCFVHAKILDGRGVTMSKSKGNGFDPADIVDRYGADAMRYVICDIETGMQDVRLPVQSDCPTCGKRVELAEAEHGRTIFTWRCTHCNAEFDVLGTMDDVPAATVMSDRFDGGRAFCNKLWNATRFALMNLGELSFQPLSLDRLAVEDRWILSRLDRTIENVSGHLQGYSPALALGAAREFFWGELCDWYLELIKPRMKDEAQAPVARQVLACVLDHVLRLLHPFVPFITETLWEQLGAQAPVRGIAEPLPASDLCMTAAWPRRRPEWDAPDLERELHDVMQVIGRIRELRARHGVPPRTELPAALRTSGDMLAVLTKHAPIVRDQARLHRLDIGPDVAAPSNSATHVAGDVEILLGDVLDPQKERERLEGQIQKLDQQLAGCRRKLDSESFVAKAPAAVVEKEKARVIELEAQIATLRANLERLG